MSTRKRNKNGEKNMSHSLLEVKEEFLEGLREHFIMIQEALARDDLDAVKKRVQYIASTDLPMFVQEYETFRNKRR